MTFDIHEWWAALSATALFNCALWLWAAHSLRAQQQAPGPSPTKVQRAQLWLSSVYVSVCAFRSVLPRADVQRICLLDSWLSSVFVGRSVATVAELCFALQWALFIQHSAAAQQNAAAHRIGRLLVPMIAGAELASWYAVVSTNFLGNVIEQSTWTLSGALIGVCYWLLYPRAEPMLRRHLLATSSVIVAFVGFMCTVDIPHYAARWLADERAGKRYLGLGEGLWDAATRWVVTYDWNAWSDEVAWMSLYFSIGVWVSISFSHAPLGAAEAWQPTPATLPTEPNRRT